MAKHYTQDAVIGALRRDIDQVLRLIKLTNEAVLFVDEFAVILEAIVAPREAQRLRRILQRALDQPIEFNDHRLVTAASIGIASCYPHDGSSEHGRLAALGRSSHVPREACTHYRFRITVFGKRG